MSKPTAHQPNRKTSSCDWTGYDRAQTRMMANVRAIVSVEGGSTSRSSPNFIGQARNLHEIDRVARGDPGPQAGDGCSVRLARARSPNVRRRRVRAILDLTRPEARESRGRPRRRQKPRRRGRAKFDSGNFSRPEPDRRRRRRPRRPAPMEEDDGRSIRSREETRRLAAEARRAPRPARAAEEPRERRGLAREPSRTLAAPPPAHGWGAVDVNLPPPPASDLRSFLTSAGLANHADRLIAGRWRA